MALPQHYDPKYGNASASIGLADFALSAPAIALTPERSEWAWLVVKGAAAQPPNP